MFHSESPLISAFLFDLIEKWLLINFLFSIVHCSTLDHLPLTKRVAGDLDTISFSGFDVGRPPWARCRMAGLGARTPGRRTRVRTGLPHRRAGKLSHPVRKRIIRSELDLIVLAEKK